MVVFQHIDRVGNAEGNIRLELVLVLVGAVTSLSLQMPVDRLGQGCLTNGLADIVGDAVLIEELLLLKFSVLGLHQKGKADAGIDHRLAVKHVTEKVVGDIDVGKDLKIGSPMHHGTRALFLGGEGSLLQFSHDLALLEGDGALGGAVVGFDHHKFRAVLCRAGAKTVQTQRIFVGRVAAVVFVFTAGVKLAVDQIPVPAPLTFVPAKGNTASVVIHHNALIGVDGDLNFVAVSFLCLVHRVGKDLKKGVLTALQAVGAENNRRALAHAVGALEGFDALIVILLLLGAFRRHVSSLSSSLPLL